MYFSSQRGPTPGGNHGVTFEITGPWLCEPKPPEEIPDTPQLGLSAVPNPFRSDMTLSFSTAAGGAVRLSVYDALGREVRSLEDTTRSAGSHTMSWDGRDNAGRAVPSGMYVVRLQSQGGVVAKKVYRRF